MVYRNICVKYYVYSIIKIAHHFVLRPALYLGVLKDNPGSAQSQWVQIKKREEATNLFHNKSINIMNIMLVAKLK